MNTVNLIGRLTANPVVRTASNDTTVGNLRLAVQRPRKDGQDQGADYVDITVFGRQAKLVGDYLSKGRKIAVHGRLHHSEWDSADGHRQKLEVIADQIEFLDPRQTQAAEADQEAEPVPDAA